MVYVNRPARHFLPVLLTGTLLWSGCAEPTLEVEPGAADFSAAKGKIWTVKVSTAYNLPSESIFWFKDHFIAFFESTFAWRAGHFYIHKPIQMTTMGVDFDLGDYDWPQPGFAVPISSVHLTGPFFYRFDGSYLILSPRESGRRRYSYREIYLVNEYRDSLDSSVYYDHTWRLASVSDNQVSNAMSMFAYELAFMPDNQVQLETIYLDTSGTSRVEKGIYGMMGNDKICLLPQEQLQEADDVINYSSISADLRLRYIIFQSREISLEGDSLLNLSSIYGQTTFRAMN